MFRYFIICISIGIMFPAKGQTLSPSLIGSGFAHATDPSFGSLDWSIGETIISTFNPMPGSGPSLTQGFHQAFVNVVTATEEVPDSDQLLNQVTFFPNPANEEFEIQSVEPITVRIINLLGFEVFHSPVKLSVHHIHVQEMASGFYVLELLSATTNTYQIFKLQIIH